MGPGWFIDVCTDLDLIVMLQCSMGLNFRDLWRYCKGFLLRCSKLDTITQKSQACHNRVMHACYADHFVLPLPEGHRFPMAKYRLLRDRIAEHLPGAVLKEALPAPDEALARVHSPQYINAVAHGTLAPAAQREIGFPWSPAMAERARRSVGATLAATRAAWREGVAGNLAGGTHHSYADKGSGFCVFNDVAVAARQAQADHLNDGSGWPLQVAVIDLDVHQGNGTAHIFRGDDSVFTLSLHGARNFPFRNEPSDLDVELPDGCAEIGRASCRERVLRLV